MSGHDRPPRPPPPPPPPPGQFFNQGPINSSCPNRRPPQHHPYPPQQWQYPQRPMGPGYGPPNGPPYGPPHGPPRGQNFGPPHGPPRGPPNGPPHGPQHGPPHGPPFMDHRGPGDPRMQDPRGPRPLMEMYDPNYHQAYYDHHSQMAQAHAAYLAHQQAHPDQPGPSHYPPYAPPPPPPRGPTDEIPPPPPPPPRGPEELLGAAYGGPYGYTPPPGNPQGDGSVTPPPLIGPRTPPSPSPPPRIGPKTPPGPSPQTSPEYLGPTYESPPKQDSPPPKDDRESRKKERRAMRAVRNQDGNKAVTYNIDEILRGPGENNTTWGAIEYGKYAEHLVNIQFRKVQLSRENHKHVLRQVASAAKHFRFNDREIRAHLMAGLRFYTNREARNGQRQFTIPLTERPAAPFLWLIDNRISSMPPSPVYEPSAAERAKYFPTSPSYAPVSPLRGFGPASFMEWEERLILSEFATIGRHFGQTETECPAVYGEDGELTEWGKVLAKIGQERQKTRMFTYFHIENYEFDEGEDRGTFGQPKPPQPEQPEQQGQAQEQPRQEPQEPQGERPSQQPEVAIKVEVDDSIPAAGDEPEQHELQPGPSNAPIKVEPKYDVGESSSRAGEEGTVKRLSREELINKWSDNHDPRDDPGAGPSNRVERGHSANRDDDEEAKKAKKKKKLKKRKKKKGRRPPAAYADPKESSFTEDNTTSSSQSTSGSSGSSSSSSSSRASTPEVPREEQEPIAPQLEEIPRRDRSPRPAERRAERQQESPRPNRINSPPPVSPNRRARESSRSSQRPQRQASNRPIKARETSHFPSIGQNNPKGCNFFAERQMEIQMHLERIEREKIEKSRGKGGGRKNMRIPFDQNPGRGFQGGNGNGFRGGRQGRKRSRSRTPPRQQFNRNNSPRGRRNSPNRFIAPPERNRRHDDHYRGNNQRGNDRFFPHGNRRNSPVGGPPRDFHDGHRRHNNVRDVPLSDRIAWPNNERHDRHDDRPERRDRPDRIRQADGR